MGKLTKALGFGGLSRAHNNYIKFPLNSHLLPTEIPLHLIQIRVKARVI